MRTIEQRTLRRSGLGVTSMGLGGSPLGNRARPMREEDAAALIEAAWSAGIRYFDTAPLYGHGLAEARLGHGLRWQSRDEYVISSKVGRVLRSNRSLGCGKASAPDAQRGSNDGRKPHG